MIDYKLFQDAFLAYENYIEDRFLSDYEDSYVYQDMFFDEVNQSLIDEVINILGSMYQTAQTLLTKYVHDDDSFWGSFDYDDLWDMIVEIFIENYPEQHQQLLTLIREHLDTRPYRAL